VRREAANRVTIDCWYQRRLGTTGPECTWAARGECAGAQLAPTPARPTALIPQRGRRASSNPSCGEKGAKVRLHQMGKDANRNDRGFGREVSRTAPFRDARRFPATRWYPVLTCTRTPRTFGIIFIAQGAFSVAPHRTATRFGSQLCQRAARCAPVVRITLFASAPTVPCTYSDEKVANRDISYGLALVKENRY
jgi:hypothetical protein